MTYEPFSESEYSHLKHSVLGESREWSALQEQLDSLRYKSHLYTARRFLGMPVRRRTIRRSIAGLLFYVDWGYGCRDWLLGDRRRIVLNDSIARLANDHFLCSELVINEGRLCACRTVGVMECLGGHILPLRATMRDIHPVAFYYCDPWDSDSGIGPCKLLNARTNDADAQVSPPCATDRLTCFQQWVLSLKALQLIHPVSGRLLLRTARSATMTEIAAFELAHDVAVPAELREFWLLTNGASFFGDIVRGTYDAPVFRTKEERMIVLLDSMEEEGIFLVVGARPYGAPDSSVFIVYEEDMGTQQRRRTWHSLRECFESLISDKEVKRAGE
jgi:hypothetical protein